MEQLTHLVEYDGLESFHRTISHQLTVTSFSTLDGRNCIRLPSPDSQHPCTMFARLTLDVTWPESEEEQGKVGALLRDEVATYLKLPPLSVTVLHVFKGSFNADLSIADVPELHPNETSLVWLHSLRDSLGGLQLKEATANGESFRLLPKLKQIELLYVGRKADSQMDGFDPSATPLASPTLSASQSDSSVASANSARGGQALQSPSAMLVHPLEKMWAKIDALTIEVAASKADASGKIASLQTQVDQLKEDVRILHLKHTNANLLIQLAEAWQILKDMLAARLGAYHWTNKELNNLAFYINECFATELAAVDVPVSLLNLLPVVSGTPAPASATTGSIVSSGGPSKPSPLDPSYVKEGAAHLRAVLKSLNIKESTFLLCARVNAVRNDFVSHDPRAKGDKAQKEAMLSEAIATLSAVSPELSDEMFGDGGSTGALATLLKRVKGHL